MRRPTGSLFRVPEPGSARFVLRCNQCGHRHTVCLLPVQWQCSGCRQAYSISEAAYLPASSYYPQRQDNAS